VTGNAESSTAAYHQTRWDTSAQLICGEDLEVDNAFLMRFATTAP
jgi:hypothetical protein